MIENYGLSSYKEGYKVYSTISSSKQSAAVNSLRRGIEEYEFRHGFRKPNNFKELIPKEFNQRSDLFYKIGYDPSNFKDSFGLKKDLLNPLDDLLDFLSDQPRFNSFDPVLILSVDSSKISVLKRNSEIETIYLNNLSFI